MEVLMPNAANVLYTDFETAQEMFLCARPECRHDDESCVAYIPLDEGQFEPMLAVAGEKLIFCQTGASSKQLPYIAAAGLDGTGRKLLFEARADQTIDGRFYTDGQAIYYFLDTVTEKMVTTRCLMKTWLDTGDTEELYRYPDNEVTAVLIDFHQGSFIISAVLMDQAAGKAYTGYYRFDLRTCKMEEEPFYTSDWDVEGSFVDEGYLYRVCHAEQVFYRTSLTSGESEVFDYAALVGPELENSRVTLFHEFDEYCRIEFNGKKADGSPLRKEYLVNMETGQMAPFVLENTYTQLPVSIHGEYNGQLYVLIDWTEESVDLVQDGAVVPVELYLPEYALVDKRDYAASCGHYKKVERHLA